MDYEDPCMYLKAEIFPPQDKIGNFFYKLFEKTDADFQQISFERFYNQCFTWMKIQRKHEEVFQKILTIIQFLNMINFPKKRMKHIFTNLILISTPWGGVRKRIIEYLPKDWFIPDKFYTNICP
jgi:hypothetical protein